MNQSVIKALKLLDFFSSEQKELTLSELSNKSDMPRPTAYRLLSSLEACGFLSKIKNTDQDVRYRLGLKLLELGGIVAEQLELRNIALPWMQELCEDINEAVHLVVRDGDEAIYIEKVESSHAVRLHTRVGKHSELYIGSGPKLLLAYLPEEEQQAIIEKLSFAKLTENTVDNKETLRQQIQKIREEGYAISRGEQDKDTIGISYPVRDYTRQVVAALSVSGPTTRISREFEEIVRQKTKDTAAYISKELGYSEAGI
ncbi:IclR family transcriptional regulator [Aneurinibacillus migulanus]|uniref:IclR family transcriptional regulator n=1 Tax=Aneurinibacillus migulanus TaxID=47500 RepID=A0A0D1XZJ2_ANEMI|nr:IclR family transcriptional regulator [Aneurinibacillus migulanus]KIV59530.1 IclR family transcriptional regulator [Aneurinibacillus migulanus]KIV59616.1 IclR family transcriptional regulator [Aneurinibacillus migulanus]KON93145.1 IclR family transcriptional regulator [Aneurinibacillus migulanus]KPD07569.1 IclR family transcriptional regulator [Aneurinibacillus migulanus]MCP1357525.1 IclR family transcriptional regulator [Aneurinibacillus migulanus]